MEKTIVLDSMGSPIIIGIVPKPCPACEFPEVVGMMLEKDGTEFVAWCPCGAVYDDEQQLRPAPLRADGEWLKDMICFLYDAFVSKSR